jgi:hypothetical protein
MAMDDKKTLRHGGRLEWICLCRHCKTGTSLTPCNRAIELIPSVNKIPDLKFYKNTC